MSSTLRAPELVRDVHRAYVKAGAEVLETNTLRREPAQARAVRARDAGRARSTRARREIAREAAGDRRARRRRRRPARRSPRAVRPDEPRRGARRSSASRWQALNDGGADLLHPRDVRRPRRDRAGDRRGARRSTPTMPVIAQMTIGADGLTPYGATPEDVARTLDELGADVIGLNCSVGPQTILEAIEKMAPVTQQEAERAAERRHAARRRRAQHVHGEPRVHGDVRAPSHAGGREDHRRLLRNDAGAHPGDGARAFVRSRRASREPSVRDRMPRTRGSRCRHATAPRRRGVEPVPLRRALALGGEDRARRVRHVGGDRAAARRRCDARCSRTCARSRSRASMR